MLTLLEMNYLSLDGMDKRVWKPDSKGNFSVKTFYNVLTNYDMRVEGAHNFWNFLVFLEFWSFIGWKDCIKSSLWIS